MYPSSIGLAALVIVVVVAETATTTFSTSALSLPGSQESPQPASTSVLLPTWTDYLYGPTTGPDAPVVTCNAQWIEFDARDDILRSSGPAAVITSTESYATSNGACTSSVYPEDNGDIHTGPVTSLCDGATRAVGPLESVTYYYPGTGPCTTGYTTFSYEETVYRHPESTPACSLPKAECANIWSTYRSLSSAYQTSQSTPTPSVSPLRPSRCSTSTAVLDACDSCHFNADDVTLYYWPSTRTPDLCTNNSTINNLVPVATVTQPPSTVVVEGHTFVSPTAYLSFDSINAASNRRRGPGGFCGTDHTNTIISANIETLHTVRSHRNGKYPIIGTRYPLQAGDFDKFAAGTNTSYPLVDKDAYSGGPQCPFDAPCTLIRDNYKPWLELPQEVRGIDERWSLCDLDWQLPTIIAIPLGNAVVQTAATPPKATPAAPRLLMGAPTPTPTEAEWSK